MHPPRPAQNKVQWLAFLLAYLIAPPLAILPLSASIYLLDTQMGEIFLFFGLCGVGLGYILALPLLPTAARYARESQNFVKSCTFLGAIVALVFALITAPFYFVMMMFDQWAQTAFYCVFILICGVTTGALMAFVYEKMATQFSKISQ
jgi:hypothetical protein